MILRNGWSVQKLVTMHSRSCCVTTFRGVLRGSYVSTTNFFQVHTPRLTGSTRTRVLTDSQFSVCPWFGLFLAIIINLHSTSFLIGCVFSMTRVIHMFGLLYLAVGIIFFLDWHSFPEIGTVLMTVKRATPYIWGRGVAVPPVVAALAVVAVPPWSWRGGGGPPCYDL